MKKIIGILFFVSILNAKAQITLEQTYSSAGYNSTQRNQLYGLQLEVEGDKFIFIDRTNKVIKFYDLNHTLWKTISFAGATDVNPNGNSQPIMYISQHLFDLDDEIEFLYVDTNGPGNTVTQVINEDGSVLFTATNQAPYVFPTAPQEQVPIFNTNSGTKLILSGDSNSDFNAYMYSLGGTLITGIIADPNDDLATLRTSIPYPNPTSSSTKIDYTLPNGVNTGEIVFYDVQGKEVKRFTVDRMFTSITISTEELQSGVYYYSLQTVQGVSDGKKLVTIK